MNARCKDIKVRAMPVAYLSGIPTANYNNATICNYFIRLLQFILLSLLLKTIIVPARTRAYFHEICTPSCRTLVAHRVRQCVIMIILIIIMMIIMIMILMIIIIIITVIIIIIILSLAMTIIAPQPRGSEGRGARGAAMARWVRDEALSIIIAVVMISMNISIRISN